MAGKNDSELVLTFTVEKETKNFVRYQEVANGPPWVGTLYVHRAWAEGVKKLTVILRKEE